MATLSCFCMVACRRLFVLRLCLVTSGIEDVFDTLITGSGRKEECLPAGGFQSVNGILVGQF